MAFNCAGEGGPPNAAMVDPDLVEQTHSAFGDGYSVKSRSVGSYTNHTTGNTTAAMPTSHHYHGRNSSSLRYNSNGRPSLNHHHDDEPEADYDDGATDLYRRIENKDWDGALHRLEQAPLEAKTWVSRREYGTERTRWRLLPLHAVCIFRAPLALIEALIEVYPDGPKMKDDQGMLPVHLACRNGASKGVVLTLLSAFPESIHVRDRKGRSPSDLVETSNSANKEAVLFALRRFWRESGFVGPPAGGDGSMADTNSYITRGAMDPFLSQPGGGPLVGNGTMMTQNSQLHPAVAAANLKASQQQQAPQPPGTPYPATGEPAVVNEVDYAHRTVLFRLILKKDWKAAAARAATHAEEASTWIVTKGFNGNLRFLPLHKACVLQPSNELIQALLTSYADGVRAKDQDGWLPIHCACFYGAEESVIQTLLDAHPPGAQSKDDDGRLPLHYACLKGATQGVVDGLLASFPKGALSKDDEGRLPIHHACGKGAPEGVVDALLKASPKGAQSKDDQGRLPLHHACRKNATERVVRTLIRVYPRAAQIKDDQDKLPIHYACQNGASVNVVSLLLATYPESVNVKNGFGYTPVGEAKSHSDNPKMEPIIKVLEKTKRDFDRKRLEDGEAGVAVADEKVKVLENRITLLEKSLNKVALLGKEMQKDVRKHKDPYDVLEKFSEKLMELGEGSNSTATKGAATPVKEKTPLKSRQATPIKNLFSRNKNSNSGQKAVKKQ